MPASHPVLGLGHAAVYDEHLVTAVGQRLGDPPTDEAGAADDENAHAYIITPQDRPRSSRERMSCSPGILAQWGSIFCESSTTFPSCRSQER
jgi:hypothetical protein